jgi:hypothetical protein
MALGGPPLARQAGQAAWWVAVRACSSMCYVVQHVFDLLVDDELVVAVTCNMCCACSGIRRDLYSSLAVLQVLVYAASNM